MRRLLSAYGWQDQPFAADAELLEAHGHEVRRSVQHNDDIDRMSHGQAALDTFWSPRTCREVMALVRGWRLERHVPEVRARAMDR